MGRFGLVLLLGLLLLCTPPANGMRVRGAARRKRTTTTAEDDALAVAAAAAAAVAPQDAPLSTAQSELGEQAVAVTSDSLEEGDQGPATAAVAGSAVAAKATAGCASGQFEWPAKTGYCWYKRDSSGVQQGPGSNVFNASNVAVNSANQLVLTINNPNTDISTSSCGEVFTSKSYGYGDYVFVVETNPALVDTRLVGAPFLYADDTREYDFEFSKWNWASDPDNSQYVVQPYTVNTPRRFNINAINTTHRLRWSSASVVFESYWPESMGGGLISSFTYSGPNNFAPGSERVHINYWIFSRVNAIPQSSTFVTNCFRFCASKNLATCSTALRSKPRCSSTRTW